MVLFSGLSACFNTADSVNKETETINVTITSYLGDQQVFYKGDILSFFLSLDKPAYITVVYEDAGGNLIQVLPNTQQADNYYEPGDFISIPSDDTNYRLQVQPPYGVETLWVFASSTRPDDIEWKKITGSKLLENGLYHLNTGITDLKSYLAMKHMNSFGSAHMTITTLEK